MVMERIEMEIPGEMVPFLKRETEEDRLEQFAMLLYPFVQDGTISHGRAAEILGMHKLDLIALYGKMGLSYFDDSAEDLMSDLNTLKSLRTMT